MNSLKSDASCDMGPCNNTRSAVDFNVGQRDSAWGASAECSVQINPSLCTYTRTLKDITAAEKDSVTTVSSSFTLPSNTRD